MRIAGRRVRSILREPKTCLNMANVVFLAHILYLSDGEPSLNLILKIPFSKLDVVMRKVPI